MGRMLASVSFVSLSVNYIAVKTVPILLFSINGSYVSKLALTLTVQLAI